MLTLYDAEAPNPFVVRLFILERGHLQLNVEHVDIRSGGSRSKHFRTNVNARGEIPCLRISDSFVLTEITAVCEYLDEIANGGSSLYGTDALQRAETRMWLRRMDMEIAQPLIQWFRNAPEMVDFFAGNRIPIPEARPMQKVLVHKGLNALEEDLEGKDYLCGGRYSAADVHFYGLVKPLAARVDWVLTSSRPNVTKYFERIDARQASKNAASSFKENIKL